MTGPYDGRAAIVVGAAGSVGGAIAARLAKEGADVVLADIGSDHLESVAARIGVTSRARAVEIDLADNASVESAVAQALEFLGHLDIVVDAAGISHQGRTFDEESPEGFAQVVSVNLTGAYLLAKATVGHLPPGSDLVFIGSSGADAPLPVNFAYGASKAGMHHLTKSLAVALADRRTRVNCVSPGASTRLWECTDWRSATARSTPWSWVVSVPPTTSRRWSPTSSATRRRSSTARS